MKAVDTDEPPSVYVKLQISDKSDKEKTDTAKESFYPVFNETLVCMSLFTSWHESIHINQS